jgi:hypothetical protein
MSESIIDVADLDVIYLSYDEPQKEEFWLKIKHMVHWAKRVDNVYGSDAAHKAAAIVSETERFILIDGDNLPHEDFFNLQFTIDEYNHQAQFRWRAKNHVNNLYYGNGGLSSWTRDFVLNMKTHENSLGDTRTNIEFCFDPLYWPMHDCYSTTYINYTPKQAWRAGFREGVKLCTRGGEIPPSPKEFIEYLWPKNLKNLSIWYNLGRDVENGWWAMYGARMGTYYLMLRDWDHTLVRDFKYLDELWVETAYSTEEDCIRLGEILKHDLGIDIVEFNAKQSKFFKDYISNNWFNRGCMVKEIDVIRELEGW